MLTYSPEEQKYPGDGPMRRASQQNRKRTAERPTTKNRVRQGTASVGIQSARSIGTGGSYCVQAEELNEAMGKARICGNLGSLADHLQTFAITSRRTKGGGLCAYCGKRAYTKCSICDVYLHNFPIKGQFKNHEEKPACSIHWHDKAHFGIAFHDSQFLQSKRGMKWKPPSKTALKANKDHIDYLSTTGGSADI